MMRARLLIGATAILLGPVGAAAQTAAPPPPRSEPAKPAAPASPVPAPAKSGEAAKPVTLNEVADLTTTATSATFNGGMTAIAGSGPSLDVRRQTRIVNKGLDAVGNAGTLIDVAASGYEVGTEIEKGNYAEAARKGAAATINTCVDFAIDATCRAATLTYTGPASVYTSPLCVAAVQIAKTCAEKLTGTTLGDAAVKYGEQAARMAGGAYDAFKRDMDDKRAASADRMATVRDANEHAIAEQAAQQQAALDAANQAAASANDAMFFNGLMQGLGSSFASPPIPLAPAAASSGCHPGHDEAAHPRGCHTPRGGTAN